MTRPFSNSSLVLLLSLPFLLVSLNIDKMSSAISPMADQQHTPATPENAVSASSKGKGKDVNLAVLNPRTLDEMMRYRARLTPDLPLVSYPSSGIDYVNYTSLQLDVFAFRAAKYYALHMPSRSSSIEKPKVIGLLGPSDFNYIITMLSLWKVGHTVLLLSTRIAKEAHISLLKATGAKDLLFHESTNGVASRLRGVAVNSLIFESRNSLARACITTP